MSSKSPSAARISSAPPGADIVHAAGVEFVRRSRISFPILHGAVFPPLSGKTVPPHRNGMFFSKHSEAREILRFPMNALPFFPPDAGITISTLRVDDIRLCRTISTPAAWTIFASRGSQTMKPRNLFGFGASFTPCPGVARKGGDGWQLSTPGARAASAGLGVAA